MSDHSHLRVTFYTEAVEDAAATRVQGRLICKDEEFVFILIGGDPKSTIRAPAHSHTDRDPMTGEQRTYAQKFPDEYRFFKANEDQHQASGTPLTEVPWLTAARREELKALKIFTVEALAGLDGTLLQRIGMGGRELKNKAQAWLDAAAGHAGESRLAEELAARDLEIAAMKEQIALLTSHVAPSAPAVHAPIAPVTDADEGIWASYSDEDIKVFLADRSGRRPAGNPKRETLIAMASEIIEAEKAAA